eukprot:10847434-Karenia_brevis.AAC.1
MMTPYGDVESKTLEACRRVDNYIKQGLLDFPLSITAVQLWHSPLHIRVHADDDDDDDDDDDGDDDDDD